MGQPILWGGERAKVLKCQMRRVWRVRLDKEVKMRVREVGRVRTLYK